MRSQASLWEDKDKARHLGHTADCINCFGGYVRVTVTLRMGPKRLSSLMSIPDAKANLEITKADQAQRLNSFFPVASHYFDLVNIELLEILTHLEANIGKLPCVNGYP